MNNKIELIHCFIINYVMEVKKVFKNGNFYPKFSVKFLAHQPHLIVDTHEAFPLKILNASEGGSWYSRYISTFIYERGYNFYNLIPSLFFGDFEVSKSKIRTKTTQFTFVRSEHFGRIRNHFESGSKLFRKFIRKSSFWTSKKPCNHLASKYFEFGSKFSRDNVRKIKFWTRLKPDSFLSINIFKIGSKFGRYDVRKSSLWTRKKSSRTELKQTISKVLSAGQTSYLRNFLNLLKIRFFNALFRMFFLQNESFSPRGKPETVLPVSKRALFGIIPDTKAPLKMTEILLITYIIYLHDNLSTHYNHSHLYQANLKSHPISGPNKGGRKRFLLQQFIMNAFLGPYVRRSTIGGLYFNF